MYKVFIFSTFLTCILINRSISLTNKISKKFINPNIKRRLDNDSILNLIRSENETITESSDDDEEEEDGFDDDNADINNIEFISVSLSNNNNNNDSQDYDTESLISSNHQRIDTYRSDKNKYITRSFLDSYRKSRIPINRQEIREVNRGN